MVTFGAPSAHSMKYSKGGLRRLLGNLREAYFTYVKRVVCSYIACAKGLWLLASSAACSFDVLIPSGLMFRQSGGDNRANRAKNKRSMFYVCFGFYCYL